MSTNTTAVHGGSVQYMRGALGAVLAVILLAAAAIFALNAGASGTGIAPAPASDSQVLQKALIDGRAGERPAPAAGSDSDVLQKALIDGRAGERPAPAAASDSEVLQKGLIDVRAGERP